MKKPRHFIGKSRFHKDFGDIFVGLAERHVRHEVWSDFITMSACAISNAGDMRFQQEREALYMASVKRYTHDEANMLAQMLGYVVMALEENPEQDCCARGCRYRRAGTGDPDDDGSDGCADGRSDGGSDGGSDDGARGACRR